MPDSRRFCLMTTGRAGSTGMMDALVSSGEVAVPARNCDCRDHELLHHRGMQERIATIAGRVRKTIRFEGELIDAFYQLNADMPWAGFKSMPHRHKDFLRFSRRRDIQFITLTRRDVAATVASFQMAMQHGTWRRDGGDPGQFWRFDPARERKVAENLSYVLKSRKLLLNISNAIHLYYEDLCAPDFSHSDLNRYFERPVSLIQPKPPIQVEDYVENAADFKAFVERLSAA